MIKSMTGYGKANLIKDTRTYTVEIKSVNHRYLDISIKMPKSLNYLEEEIKKEISKKVKRGKIDVFINFEDSKIDAKEIKINKEIAKIYIKELKELAQEENITDDISITKIAMFPDVLTMQNIQEDENIKPELIETIDIAVKQLINMRKTEGEKISQDLLSRIELINKKNKEISSISTGLIDEYVVKLEKRIKELLKEQEIDKTRIAQEVVIYADKCSIEEITRLESHIMQFKQFLNSDEAIGKKIDFLIQEMNRETNTIGSKANSLEITNGVISIKTELENIREQIQNIE